MTDVPGAGSGSGHWLERQWYRTGPWQLVLLPVSALFWLLSMLRRMAYRCGWFAVQDLPVAVVVVGNVSVGGTGKTPLVLWLARFLQQHGFRPGIVSRGYGGRSGKPRQVDIADDADLSGDDPLLLARQCGCPVWTGRDRVMAGRALLDAHPECNVIISDDGLQHYRLARDVEIAVVDGVRLLGNGLLLPAGPLREGRWRLRQVDAVVMNGAGDVPGVNAFRMSLRGAEFRNMKSGAKLDASGFRGKRLHAAAGIGYPQRFFEHLRGLGLDVVAHPFPDHHMYRPEDFDWPDAEAILMTEKDAVKCVEFADARYWALPVQAETDPQLGRKILDGLRKHDGREIA